MQKFFLKMERKYGKYAISNLPLLLIICYAFGYLIQFVKPEFLMLLTLNPYAICHGQIWRLFSWILVPPEGFDFLTLIMLYFYYSLGRTLERTWGTFRFNVYMFSGFLFTVIGSFILYLYFVIGMNPAEIAEYESIYLGLLSPDKLSLYGGSFFYASIFSGFSTYYVNMSIFLAFAIMYPDMKVYLFFVLPIKMKVMGIIYVVLMGYQILASFYHGGAWTIVYGIVTLCIIGSSLLNTLICFLLFKSPMIRSPKQVKRQHEFKAKVRQASSNVSRHKCAICGRTEMDDANLSFRFCSKCDGNYEYCSDHIFTHEHVKKQ